MLPPALPLLSSCLLRDELSKTLPTRKLTERSANFGNFHAKLACFARPGYVRQISFRRACPDPACRLLA